MTYIGETKRPVRLRFNEHLRDAINEAKYTLMGDHFRECHPTMEKRDTPPFKIRIMYRSRDHPDRKIAESLLIQKERQLNCNLTSWPIL